MSEETFFFRFSVPRDKLSELFLLLGTLSLESTSGDAFSLNGVKNHLKFGLPGVEDGSNHQFDTIVCYLGVLGDGKVSLNSIDGGNTYQGGVKFKVDARTDKESIQKDIKIFLKHLKKTGATISDPDPASWIASKDLEIRNLLKEGNLIGVKEVEDEVALALGKPRASWWVSEIVEKYESEKIESEEQFHG